MNHLISNISIQAKVIGNSVILFSLLIALAGYSLHSMNRIGTEWESIADQHVPLTRLITAINEHQLEQAHHFERALRFGSDISNAGNMAIYAEDVKRFQQLTGLIKNRFKGGYQFIQESINKAHTQAEKDKFTHFAKVIKKIELRHKSYDHSVSQVLELYTNGQPGLTLELGENIEKEEEFFEESLKSLLLEVERFTEETALFAEAHEQRTGKVMMILTVLSLVSGGILSWLISSNIIKRLGVTSKSLGVIASGDLTQSVVVDGRDEIGQLQESMRDMQDKLLQMICRIGDTTSQLSSTSEEVSVIMGQTSDNIQQQTAETEQITDSMNEMSQAVQEVVKSVMKTTTSANEANSETEQGHKVVNETVQGIQQLAGLIENTSTVIAQVEQDSDNINTVLDVIKGIAEQTNLLALNAAIEAARAGEQGRGFAVVADEVRTLAGKTQLSATEINQIIEKLQSGARNAVQSMKQSQQQTDVVVDQAKKAGESLQSIASSVAHIDDMTTQIATAAEEQNAVAENMNGNIGHINVMAQQNASSAEETSIAGKDLARIATDLQLLVSEFKV